MIFAKKSLGQNFLKSDKALREIVDAGDIKEGDTILEIGPGEGALTGKILEKNPLKLVAVEKDDRLISFLEETFSGNKGNLKIIHGDILDLLSREKDLDILKSGLKQPFKVIANIPYYITGIVIRNIFELETLPDKVVLLLQKEVADRIVASDKKESLLSLSIKLYGTPRRISIVPRGAFVPAPNVDSAIILIENISRTVKKGDEESFFRLIKAAFAHKRKQLAGNLDGVGKKNRTEWAETLLALGFKADVRAEDLKINDFLKILKLIGPNLI